MRYPVLNNERGNGCDLTRLRGSDKERVHSNIVPGGTLDDHSGGGFKA